MFVLYDKRTGLKSFIYGVNKNKDGYADFLIRNNGRWCWENAKHYIPLAEYGDLVECEEDSNLTK